MNFFAFYSTEIQRRRLEREITRPRNQLKVRGTNAIRLRGKAGFVDQILTRTVSSTRVLRSLAELGTGFKTRISAGIRLTEWHSFAGPLVQANGVRCRNRVPCSCCRDPVTKA
jgi:hypothetical protein